MNYFEIFDLPTKYNLDENNLSKRYMQKQKSLFSANSNNISVINVAYNVLKNPIKRGEYYLGLYNRDCNKMSEELAFQMFNMRDEYENLLNKKEKQDFQIKLRQSLDNELEALSKLSDDIDKFQEKFIKIKFLDSFLGKIKEDVYSRD